MSRLRPIVPTRFRRRPATDSVESLLERISSLTCERQALRARGAGAVVLERNRVQIARSQWELSYALIERYVPQPAASSAAA